MVDPWPDDERAKKQQQAERERNKCLQLCYKGQTYSNTVFRCIIKASLTVTQFIKVRFMVTQFIKVRLRLRSL